jgi:hypothetical protein
VESIPRLDPFALPVSYAVPMAGRSPGAAFSATIDRDMVAVTGPTGRASLPMRAFRGVAVRIVAGASGEVTALLELNHSDPALSLTLLVAEDPAELAADWKAWSRSLGLPMLLIEPDGKITRPVETLGPVEIAAPKPRRMYSYFASRRPRFLARRKTGWRRDTERFAGEEIIARD